MIAGDLLFAGNLDGHVYALNRHTGERRWRTDLGAPVRARAAVADGVLVVPTEEGTLWGLRPADGTPAWQPVEVGGRLYTDLTTVQGDVVLAPEIDTKSHRLYRVDAGRGSITPIMLRG